MYAVRSRNSSGRPSGEHSACEAQAVEHRQPEEHGRGHDDVAIERQGGRELSVEKRRESARTAAGRAGAKMEEPTPKAQVRAARQHFGGIRQSAATAASKSGSRGMPRANMARLSLPQRPPLRIG